MIDPDKVFHVLPTNDLKEHYRACLYDSNFKYPYCPCECMPTYQEEEEGLLIVHNSFDGRENFEKDAKVRNN